MLRYDISVMRLYASSSLCAPSATLFVAPSATLAHG
jgi:hypothetical protein